MHITTKHCSVYINAQYHLPRTLQLLLSTIIGYQDLIVARCVGSRNIDYLQSNGQKDVIQYILLLSITVSTLMLSIIVQKPYSFYYQHWIPILTTLLLELPKMHCTYMGCLAKSLQIPSKCASMNCLCCLGIIRAN